ERRNHPDAHQPRRRLRAGLRRRPAAARRQVRGRLRVGRGVRSQGVRRAPQSGAPTHRGCVVIYLLALIPATVLTIAGYVVLVLSTRAEGGLRSFGRYLGFWAFTLAG